MKNRTKSFFKTLRTYAQKQAVVYFLLISLIVVGFISGRNESVLGQRITNALNLIRPSKDTVSAKELKKLLEEKSLPSTTFVDKSGAGFTFINVHTPYEGEIEKTDSFVPYDQMVAQSGALPKDKNTPIILYCKTGRMSGESLVTMQKLGYTNVRHLTGGMEAWEKSGGKTLDLSLIEQEVLPEASIELPVAWGDLGPKLIALGVIDEEKFKKAVKLTPEQEEILTLGSSKKIRIDRTNGQFVVDMLWAMGLAQKSLVYEEGPMGQKYKKDAGNFASTGGWSLARGNAIGYLNRFDLIPLTPEQQKTVGEIAKNIYRPCCGNSTWFPDCNHGMAALAAIELMVAAGLPENTIYRNVLALNTYWFADTYVTIATLFARNGTTWKDVDPKTILGREYSSAQGAQAVAKKVGPLPYKPEPQGGGCGA